MAQYRFPQDFEIKSYRARHIRKNSNTELNEAGPSDLYVNVAILIPFFGEPC